MEFVQWRVIFKEKLNQPTTEHHYYARIIFAIRCFQAAFSKKARRPKYSDCLVKYKTKTKENRPELEDSFEVEEEKRKAAEASRSRWSSFFSSMIVGKKEGTKK